MRLTKLPAQKTIGFTNRVFLGRGPWVLLNALPVALVSESFGYLTERLAFRVNGSAANGRFA